jgi:hypothetical protein
MLVSLAYIGDIFKRVGCEGEGEGEGESEDGFELN